MEIHQKVPLDDRGKRSNSLRGDIVKAFKSEGEESFLKKEKKHPLTPSSVEHPAFLMNYPFTIDNKVKNNILMNKGKKPYDHRRAFDQFMNLYRLIVAAGAFVHNLPSKTPPLLQDLPFVANVGAYLPHIKPDTILIANFKSPPRKGEDKIADSEFKKMNYVTDRPPTHWEGEADLKWIKNNTYIGGYGIRTDIRSYHWMMDNHNMNVIPIRMTDQKLYHFDCQFFPMSSDKALVATSVFRPEDLKKVEKHMEIISVPKEFIYDGWTNSLVLGDKILCGKYNKRSDTASDAIFEKEGFEPVGVDLNEFAKSGADLSCMICHLNFRNRE